MERWIIEGFPVSSPAVFADARTNIACINALSDLRPDGNSAACSSSNSASMRKVSGLTTPVSPIASRRMKRGHERNPASNPLGQSSSLRCDAELLEFDSFYFVLRDLRHDPRFVLQMIARKLMAHHRKLLPTNPERMVWGMGDASGLRVGNTPAGRPGSLICWESYMPFARYALYAQDIEIYIAPAWDTGESWLATMRHIAKEAGCWVIGTATALQGSDLPSYFPDRENSTPRKNGSTMATPS